MNYLIFFGGMVCGACLILVIIPLLFMSSRTNQQMEAEEAALLSGPVGINVARLLGIELPPGLYPPDILVTDRPVPSGYTWCPKCEAMFRGDLCPGCLPEIN